MLRPFSYSKLSTFLSCPRRFKYQYIDRIETPRPEHFTRGSYIHDILEHYPNKTCPEVDKFINSEVGKKYLNILTDKTAREVRFGYDDAFNLIKYSKQAMLNGIIDLIYIKDNIVHLVDWKTGRAKTEEEQDWSQLETYAIAFLDRYDVEIAYVYIDACTENKRLLTKDLRSTILNKVYSNIMRVEACKNYRCNITWQCEYCQFNNICSYKEESIENLRITF